MDEIRFDGWVLRRDSGELIRDGRPLRLPPQPFQILDALLSRPGEVVTREELVGILWPTGVVDYDMALNAAVRRLRAALGEDADRPRYIETIPRRGYRFIGTLERAVDAPGADAAPVEAPIVDTVAAAVVSSDHRSWREGASPTLRSSRVMYGAAGIAGVLAAALLWLVAGSPGRAPTDPARAHAPARGESALSRLEATIPVAAEQYRRARFLLHRRGAGDLALARDYFTRVVAAAPDFALAYAGLASVHFLETVHGSVDRDAGLQQAYAAAQRALTLDPDLVEAHLRLASHAGLTGQPRLREEHFARAAALEPAHPLVLSWRASDALSSGRLPESIELLRRAVAADPFYLPVRYNLGYALFAAGRLEEAHVVIRELQELDPERRADLLAHLAIVERRYDEALRIAQAWPDDAARWQCLALAYHGLGLRREASDALERLIQLHGEGDPLRVAEVYAFRGDVERAREWAKRTPAPSDLFAATPPLQSWALRYSPYMATLRDDARLQVTLSRRAKP